MLTNITLRNFRAFQTEVSVRIRPITVLVGSNSAGKSSLLKFLLMLRQTLDSQSQSFFVTEGRHVQLGLWNDLRNSNTRKGAALDSFFKYSLEFSSDEMPPLQMRKLWRASTRTNLVTESPDKFVLHAELPKEPVRKEQTTGRFSVSGSTRYYKTGNEFKSGRHDVEGYIDEQSIFSQTTRNLQRSGFLRFGRRDDSLNSLLSTMTAEQFLEPLRHEIISQRHLSPIREESEQTVQIGSPPPDDVGHRGEFAISHMASMFMRDDRKEEREFVERFASLVAGVEKLEFKSKVNGLLTQAKARNKETQAVCSLASFGFGVSQCLPLFVQGAMHERGQLLLVEQPEAQLHPTAQLELGTFFAELWTKRGVPAIIETHSDNIILRLRNLVKQGEMSPADISLAYLHIGDVPTKRGNTFKAVAIKNIDINEDGSLEKGLPMQFFGADVLEALKMGAGR